MSRNEALDAAIAVVTEAVRDGETNPVVLRAAFAVILKRGGFEIRPE